MLLLCHCAALCGLWMILDSPYCGFEWILDDHNKFLVDIIADLMRLYAALGGFLIVFVVPFCGFVQP